jgi:2-C-methyl-D-erythritol 4-phosphate cytidylyltransferase
VNVAVIVGGGSGERSGLEGGKQLATVAGRPVLAHTINAFERSIRTDAIVVVVHPDRVEEYRAGAVDPLGAAKVIAVVPGGNTRQRSVASGLAAVPSQATLIAIHDGARPLVTPATIDAAFEALEADLALDGIVVGHPSYDTLKSVDADGRIIGTPDRASLWAAQTPQVFRAARLREAYSRATSDAEPATDDSTLVERIGGAVRMLAGPRDNIKVTVADDLLLAERLLAAREEEELR